MSVLVLNVPVETKIPTLLVENRLAVGPHLFRLVVVDDDGLASDPFDAVVQVVDGPVVNPPIVIPPVQPVNPVGPVIRSLEQPVDANAPAAPPAAPTKRARAPRRRKKKDKP
jgi:hypothetical protein